MNRNSSKTKTTHLLKVPSMALIPIPSTMSLVNRNGTVSGVANTLPFSNAMPGY